MNGVLEFLKSISLLGWGVVILVTILAWNLPAFLRGKGRLNAKDDKVPPGDGRPDYHYTDLDGGNDS